MNPTQPRLLLLPGLEGSGTLFTGLVEALNPHYDIAIVRYPDSCRTHAEALCVVQEAIAVSAPSAIIAESFSTPLAVQLAGNADNKAGALILCNGFVANPLSSIESMMATTCAPWVLPMPLTGLVVRTFLVGPDAPEELVRAVQSAVAPVSPAVLGARLGAVMRCDTREALSRVRVPMLYMHAQRDRLIGDAGLKQIQRIRPDVRVEHVDGPHLLFQKEPRRCAEVIRKFLSPIV